MFDDGKDARERRARSHSTRIAILALLAKNERELTAREIRAEMLDGTSLRTVYFHLRTLTANGLVEEDGGRYRFP
jgi:Fe2+ or Zn2+ uptake regulation protein